MKAYPDFKEKQNFWQSAIKKLDRKDYQSYPLKWKSSTRHIDDLSKYLYGRAGYGLCPGEHLKFKDQMVSTDVFCSGILIGFNNIVKLLKKLFVITIERFLYGIDSIQSE